MTRENTLKAIDDAFADGIKRLFAVFVDGLIGSSSADEVAQHFRNGLAFHCDAHGKATAIVENYFKGFKP